MAFEAQAHNNGKAQGSRAQHRRNARSGQGIIEANRKTAICKHWIQGACPFGARCAFAHGAKELKNATAKSPPPPEMGKAKHLQSSTSRDAATCFSDPRCTLPPGASSDGESWLLKAKSPVTNQGSRDAGSHCHRGVWLETRGHSAGSNDGCARLPLQEIGTNNQPRAQDGDTFSLWQSPNTILQSPIRTLGLAGSRSDNYHHHHHTVTPPAAAQPHLRGTLRENESWAEIAQGKPIHGSENDGARASNVTAASTTNTTTTTTTTTTPPDFYGDELCRSAFRETKVHAAGPAPCSSGVVCCCRTRSSRDTPRAFGCVASVAPGPTFSTTGLAFSPRGCTSPAPPNLGLPSALQRTSTAAPAAAHRWNPINYNGSAFGGSFASSLQENAEARKPSPCPAPIPRHGMDDFLGRMMSVLSLDASCSNDDASRNVGPSVPQSWYDPFLLRPVEEKEPARLKTAQQPGGPSGDSSRLDQSYRSDSLGKSVAPGMDSNGTSTTSGDAFSIPSIGSILDEKWPTALPAGGALKDGFSEDRTTETNRSASPSPFGWGLEPSSMAPSTRVHNDVLTNPGGSFSHSLW